jgi:hypothetical protein
MQRVLRIFAVSLDLWLMGIPAHASEGGPARTILSSGPSVVSVSGHRLLVQRRNPDGSLSPAVPWIIRGVTWSPASRTTDTSPSDSTNADDRRPEFGKWYRTDIPLISAMNVNTIRTYIDFGFVDSLGTVGLAVLDSCYAHGIMVVMTVDEAINDTARVQQAVTFYRDHPAILAWSLGNEWNINLYYGVASSMEDAAARTERAAQLVKSLDTNHPVVSSYGEIDLCEEGKRLDDVAWYVNSVCPSVEVWSLNIFRHPLQLARLFDEWDAMTTKPMFLGEYGTDAFSAALPESLKARCSIGSGPAEPSGMLDEAAQANWNLELWLKVVQNLSAVDPARVGLGGTIFEWNDEWWKVPPPGSQEIHGWLPCGFPDDMASEEYFGLLDIDRNPRQAYWTMRAAYDPANIPPSFSTCPGTATFTAVSSGTVPGSGCCGFGQFRRDDVCFFHKRGCSLQCGRGFNVAVINQSSGELSGPIRNFDTWASRESGTAMMVMISYLDSIPNGRLLLIAVGDEAGINNFPPDSCPFLPYTWVTQGRNKLKELGSTKIDSLCYWSSWAMIAFKGEGHARAEALGHRRRAYATASFAVPARPCLTDVPSHPTPSDGLRISVRPNPAARSAAIHYSLPRSGLVRATIYDLQGRLMARLANEWQSLGEHQLLWDGAPRAISGMYFLHFSYEGRTYTQRIAYMR